MTSFLNLWMDFTLTDGELRELQGISPKNDVCIPFRTIWICKIPIQLRLRATIISDESGENKSFPEIELTVEYGGQKEKGNTNGLYGRMRYRNRICQVGRHRMPMGIGQWIWISINVKDRLFCKFAIHSFH